MISKHHHTLLLISISFFIVCNLYAQVGYEDVVYLKNGSIIHGMIIEQVPNQSLKIQTRDRNIFVFKSEEIEKIAKEKNGVRAQDASIDEIKKNPYSGLSVGFEAGIGNGTGSYNNNQGIICVHALVGYMHKSILTAGLSAGISLWDNVSSNANNSSTLVECGMALRVFPLRRRFTPMLAADAGYAIEPDNDNESGGIFSNLGVGCRINLTQKRALTLSINYKAQSLQVESYSYNYNNGSVYNARRYTAEAICFATGFSF